MDHVDEGVKYGVGAATVGAAVGVGGALVGVGAAPTAGCEVGVGACGVTSGAMGSSVGVTTTAGVGLAVLAGSGCVGLGAVLDGGHTQVMTRKRPSARLAQKRLSPGRALDSLPTRAASDGRSLGADAGSGAGSGIGFGWLMRASLLQDRGSDETTRQ
jgi:hypothetical protein